jgi:hypothetical protein
VRFDAFREDPLQKWAAGMPKPAPEKPHREPDSVLQRMIIETREALEAHRQFMSNLLIELVASIQQDMREAIDAVRADVATARADAAAAKAVRCDSNVAELLVKNSADAS